MFLWNLAVHGKLLWLEGYKYIRGKKVDSCLCLINQALCHEDIRGSEVELHDFRPRHQMEVSGQLHALAAVLPWGSRSPVHSGYEVGWTPEPVWTPWKEKNLAISGTEPAPPSRPPLLNMYGKKFISESCLNLKPGALHNVRSAYVNQLINFQIMITCIIPKAHTKQETSNSWMCHF
jgi:hypothetical protein